MLYYKTSLIIHCFRRATSAISDDKRSASQCFEIDSWECVCTGWVDEHIGFVIEFYKLMYILCV